jgi:hypothetical protein
VHFSLASAIIRDHIDALKSTDENTSDDDADDGRSQANSQNPTFGNVYLGAPQKRCSINELENAHLDDPAFCQFRARLADMLNELLRRDDSPVHIQSDRLVTIKAEDFVSYPLILN